MTSQYVKCDGCGSVVDRWPKGDPRGVQGDGTFGKMGGSTARKFAKEIGWIHFPGNNSGYGEKDFCPECIDRFGNAGGKRAIELALERLEKATWSPCAYPADSALGYYASGMNDAVDILKELKLKYEQP